MPRDFATLAEQIADSCVHFTGIQNQTCKAGVAYSSFDRPGLPCLKDFCKGHTCEHLHFPTAEEVAAQVAFERTRMALDGVRQDMKAKGFRRGRGGQSELPCPVCTTGTLRYSVANCNGHIHAACTTQRCVSWMQ